MKNIKAAIFDLDDTLVKTHKVKWAHHKAVAKQFYNIDLTDEVLREHWGKPFNEMIGYYYQHSDTLENMRKANQQLEMKFLKELHGDAPGVILDLLDRSIEVGVLSSSSKTHVEFDLKRLGFPIEKLSFIYGSEDTPSHKPDPQVFTPALIFLEKKEIKKKNVVYIGDALIDYYAARDAGIQFIGITSGLVSRKEFQDKNVPNIVDVIAKVKEIIE